MAAGLTFLPGFSGSVLREKQLSDRLTTGSIADYKIVIPAQSGAMEKHAAQQLQQYLSEISAASIPVIEETEFRGNQAIYIGHTGYAKTQKIDFTQLPEDGYVYKSVGNHFIIAGGARKGVLYGVYDLLEVLGFRRYSPAYTHIPKADAIRFPKKEMMIAPPIRYRTTSYSQMGNAEYADWHKLSSRDDWGLFVHTFNVLVPPAAYGTTHPEYYSLINGERRPGTQLCLSNPEVVDIVISNLKKKIAEKPGATYWSVSQNDNDKYCRCAPCTTLNEKYGAVPSGSIIYFVNQVAKAFPDKIISTLAYWYSRKAPKNIQTVPNVNIMLCNIESRRNAPVFETDPAFSNDLRDWGGLAKDILIWDYNIQFTNFFAPFPNLHTIKPNIKFYSDNRVHALFMQANAEPAAEMALLRAYLIYKLMWNPDADEKAIMDDFLNGYFSAAGPYIRQYIDAMHSSLLKSGMRLDIFGDPIDAKEAFLSAPMMEAYKQMFDQAEETVKTDAQLLERVQTARLPILYAEIQIGRTEIDTPRSLYQHQGNGMVIAKPEMKALVNKFVDGCQREGVLLVRERSGSPEHFLASYNRIFTRMEEMDKAKSFNKKIVPITHPAKKSKDVQGLTDGIFASYESWQRADPNWIFYEGEHMDFILDLGEVMPVSSINMDFLNPQAQADWHLMALPEYVTYSISVDAEKYDDEMKIINPHNPNPAENPDITKISIHAFQAHIKEEGTKARYIKVHAESLLKMPAWHIRSGEPVGIYSDEIVVK